MKPGRQSVILEVIAEQDIETQSQLMAALAERGIKSTQATLSRDIKDLRLVKELSPNGNYRYTQVERQKSDEAIAKLKRIFRESVVSYDVAQNLFIIKTIPGLAPAACSAIDGMKLENIVGTLAGDDTAFLALRDNEAAQQLFKEIQDLF